MSSSSITTSSTQKHVKSLNIAKDALMNIRKELKPFIRQLDSDDVVKKAQAQAVVALSLGTLRYMGARFQGKNEGRNKEDPLRQELDHMRKVLVELEAKHKSSSSTPTLSSAGERSSTKAKKDAPASSSKKEAAVSAVEEKKEEATKSPSSSKSNKRPTPTKEKKSTPGRSAKKSRRK